MWPSHRRTNDQLRASRLLWEVSYILRHSSPFRPRLGPCNLDTMQSWYHTFMTVCNHEAMQLFHYSIMIKCNHDTMQSWHYATKIKCNRDTIKSLHSFNRVTNLSNVSPCLCVQIYIAKQNLSIPQWQTLNCQNSHRSDHNEGPTSYTYLWLMWWPSLYSQSLWLGVLSDHEDLLISDQWS